MLTSENNTDNSIFNIRCPASFIIGAGVHTEWIHGWIMVDIEVKGVQEADVGSSN